MLDNEFIMTDEILKSSSNFTQKFLKVCTYTSYNIVCSNITQIPGRSLAFVLFYHYLPSQRMLAQLCLFELKNCIKNYEEIQCCVSKIEE